MASIGRQLEIAKRWVHARTTALRIKVTPVRPGTLHTLNEHMVVSLTSYPPRFPTLALTLRSLLSQDVRADKVVLYIAHADMPLLPKSVTDLKLQGLTIEGCEDTRQFNKLLPALEAFPTSIIVTADDDAYYPRDWLKPFVEHYRSRNEVLCRRARRIESLTAAHKWRVIDHSDEGGHVFPTGVGGVMYPPGSLHPDVLRTSEAMRLCASNDDIWFFWMARRQGSTHRLIDPVPRLVSWPQSQRTALWRTNQGKRENNRMVAAMIDAFGLPSGTPIAS